MEKIRQKEQFESKEKFGRNVKIHAIFVRHGEKGLSTITGETYLTKRGRKESKKFGKGLEKRKAIKPYSSDTERTIETAKLIVEASPTKKKMRQRVKKELGFYCLEGGDFIHEVMRIKKETLGKDFDNLSKEEKEKKLRESDKRQTDYYLSFENRRPDAGTYSPVEAAAMVARRVDLYIRMPEKLHSDTDVNLINVSHDLTLSAFLKELTIRDAEGKQVRGFNTIDEIGGPIGFNEGFEILIQTNNQGKKSVKMSFRNQECQVDTKRLNELVEIARNLEKHETTEH